ncbi:MAG: hypothetical protein A3G05_02260 [Candidatus Zambryskibacteria bacterium RIFCSPLOWO2_12_FULL_45_14]|nr:MAG: hypothetical protein A3G05_02260 [Candidatus Zambryskibacteria bacterium RIFCSPLOWO2_12_FULL_45_14]
MLTGTLTIVLGLLVVACGTSGVQDTTIGQTKARVGQTKAGVDSLEKELDRLKIEVSEISKGVDDQCRRLLPLLRSVILLRPYRENADVRNTVSDIARECRFTPTELKTLEQ